MVLGCVHNIFVSHCALLNLGGGDVAYISPRFPPTWCVPCNGNSIHMKHLKWQLGLYKHYCYDRAQPSLFFLDRVYHPSHETSWLQLTVAHSKDAFYAWEDRAWCLLGAGHHDHTVCFLVVITTYSWAIVCPWIQVVAYAHDSLEPDIFPALSN